MTKPAQQRQNKRRSGLRRLPTVYLSDEAAKSMDELVKIHGTNKAAFEWLLTEVAVNEINPKR